MPKGKQKGNNFESQIAKKLSLWLTEGEDAKQLIPSRSSGGWKPDGDRNWRHVGDLAPNGPRGEQFRHFFAVETKHHKSFDFWHVWTSEPGDNLMGWWAKLIEEIEGCADYPEHPPLPLIIFRMNYRPIMIATDLHLVDENDRVMLFPKVGMGVQPLDDFLVWEPEVVEGGARLLCKK